MDLYMKLTTCMEDLSATFTSRMAQYEEDLKNASGETQPHKTIASLSREFVDFKALIWKTLGALKTQMELLVVGLDRHEMASRMKVLLLHGLTVDKDAELSTAVVNIVVNKLKLQHFTDKDIASCHYLGTNPSKPRSVLVRFESRKTRSEVWRHKTELKGSGVTVSEFLTKPRHETFMNARKHFGIRQCWTSEGKIVVQVADQTRRRIESAAELQQLIAKFPNKPAADNSVPTNSSKHTSSTLDKRPRKVK